MCNVATSSGITIALAAVPLILNCAAIAVAVDGTDRFGSDRLHGMAVVACGGARVAYE